MHQRTLTIFTPVADRLRVSGHRRGFTLIELLTVVAIISILLAIIIPTAGAARNSADRAATKAQFGQWVAAMELFRQEYGFYPAIAPDGLLDGERFAAALTGRALDGSEPANLYGNTRRLSFYNLSVSEIEESGNALVDAFGNTEFGVRFDSSRDGVIDAADTGSWAAVRSAEGEVWSPLDADDSLGDGPLRARVVFYSAGRGKDATDLVLSWR